MLCCILHCPEPDQAVTASGFNRSPAGNKYHTTPESRWGLSSAWAGKDLKNSLGADFKVWREGLITPNCFVNIPKCEDEAGKAQRVSASLSSYDKISHPPRLPQVPQDPSQPPDQTLESSKVHSAPSSVQNVSSISSVGLPRLPSEPRIIHFHRCMLLNVLTAWPVQSLWERSPFGRQYYSSAMLLILRLLLIMTSSHTSPAEAEPSWEEGRATGVQSIYTVTV